MAGQSKCPLLKASSNQMEKAEPTQQSLSCTYDVPLKSSLRSDSDAELQPRTNMIILPLNTHICPLLTRIFFLQIKASQSEVIYVLHISIPKLQGLRAWSISNCFQENWQPHKREPVEAIPSKPAFGIQQNLDKYTGQKSLSQSPSELTINYFEVP